MSWSDDEVNEMLDAIAESFGKYPFDMWKGLEIEVEIKKHKLF